MHAMRLSINVCLSRKSSFEICFKSSKREEKKERKNIFFMLSLTLTLTLLKKTRKKKMKQITKSRY